MGWRIGLLSGVLLPTLLAAGGAWWFLEEPIEAAAEPPMTALPVPPFPPRISDDPSYESCLGLLPEDPAAALALIRGWPNGGDAARHCQGLALIAAGDVAEGATLLETLAETNRMPEPARALVLNQAADAWLHSRLYEQAHRATRRALAMAPNNVDVLVRHAQAAAHLGLTQEAITDLTRVLKDNPDRVDALLARSMAWRQLDRLEQARADIDRAAERAPTDPEVLLERGIQRQQRGDLTGAREDWQRVVSLEPDSEAADLAEQNLALLNAGPTQR